MVNAAEEACSSLPTTRKVPTTNDINSKQADRFRFKTKKTPLPESLGRIHHSWAFRLFFYRQLQNIGGEARRLVRMMANAVIQRDATTLGIRQSDDTTEARASYSDWKMEAETERILARLD